MHWGGNCKDGLWQELPFQTLWGRDQLSQSCLIITMIMIQVSSCDLIMSSAMSNWHILWHILWHHLLLTRHWVEDISLVTISLTLSYCSSASENEESYLKQVTDSNSLQASGKARHKIWSQRSSDLEITLQISRYLDFFIGNRQLAKVEINLL